MWFFSQVPQEIALVTWLCTLWKSLDSEWIICFWSVSLIWFNHLRHIARQIGLAQNPPVSFEQPSEPPSAASDEGPHHKKVPCPQETLGTVHSYHMTCQLFEHVLNSILFVFCIRIKLRQDWTSSLLLQMISRHRGHLLGLHRPSWKQRPRQRPSRLRSSLWS